MNQAIKREIIAWRIFHTDNTFYDIAIVLLKTTNEPVPKFIFKADTYVRSVAESGILGLVHL